MTRDDALTYGKHLHLDRLLTAQTPVSEAPDEMLFILQHQVSELWMRLILVELEKARDALEAGRISPVLKALNRVVVIFDQMVSSWDVLRTLTPTDFAAFRSDLGSASGFQSWQYRLIEFVLGNREPKMMVAHEPTPDVHARLAAELERPSLYQAALRLLSEQLEIPFTTEVLAPGKPLTVDADVERAWAQVHADPAAAPDLYALAERLVEVEDRFRCWRFNHVTTVERVIGFKTGTGGTSGVGYLRAKLNIVLFPELWSLRSAL